MMILEAISKAFHTAKRTGRLCCVVRCQNSDDYIIAFEHRKEWLFRAYPGGRRELSIKGNELAEEARRVMRITDGNGRF